MRIEYDNDEIEAFILHRTAHSKLYKKFLSNGTLMRDLDKVMVILDRVASCKILETSYASLHYERLKYGLHGRSSVRIGNKTKYRLVFTENEERIKICLIEISEHYGDK